MTAKTANNKHSAKKKLIPAVGMLLASAMALSSSTYAWFTMSRDVEVRGIQMTASVPENLEISLGKGMISSTGLAEGTGNATLVDAPVNTGSQDDKDWTNIVAVSDFYNFGYLLPASSVNGTDIWYTEDANEAGRSVAINAEFKQADGETPIMTSYEKLTNKTATAEFAEKNTKGYYIDIPVWFRTSVTNDITLGVVATVTPGRNDSGTVNGAGSSGAQLANAARVAILGANGAAGETQKVIASNGYTVDYYDRYDTSWVASPQAVKAAGNLGGVYASGTTAATNLTKDGVSAIYGKAEFITQANDTATAGTFAGDTVVTVTGSSTANYGASVQKTIRVWLEGEDENCWNPNANQSFTIDLKFVRLGAVNDVTAKNK